MRNAADWGLRGIDLTVGKGDLKERFSTSRADVPFIELYPRFSTYCWRRLRIFASQVKSKVMRWSESDAGKRVRQSLDSLTTRSRRPDELITMTATPTSLQTVEPSLASGEQAVFHQNQIYDLLQRAILHDDGAEQMTKAARVYADAVKQGKTFHTLLINDRLAAWGYASRSTELNQVILEGFYTLPEFRKRGLAGALAVHVVQLYFRKGAVQAVASIPKADAAARKAAARAGFLPN
jgi:GNAT superfamily N-acetyltransferase